MIVVSILILIILILCAFIVWLLFNFFIVVPKGDEPAEEYPPSLALAPAEKGNDSIVGKTKSKPLLTPPPKPKKVVPPEEMEDAFMDNEFEPEYGSESEEEDTYIPTEEQEEVIDTGDYHSSDSEESEEQEAHEEDKQIQKAVCMDYYQIEDTTKKIARNEPLDINDAETLQKLEGTDIAEQLEKAMPSYLIKAQQALSKVEY